MFYETVVNEINGIRAENGLSSVDLDQSTLLESLGLDSLMYIVLTTRLEAKLGAAAFKTTNDLAALPVSVGDLVRLFEQNWAA